MTRLTSFPREFIHGEWTSDYFPMAYLLLETRKNGAMGKGSHAFQRLGSHCSEEGGEGRKGVEERVGERESCSCPSCRLGEHWGGRKGQPPAGHHLLLSLGSLEWEVDRGLCPTTPSTQLWGTRSQIREQHCESSACFSLEFLEARGAVASVPKPGTTPFREGSRGFAPVLHPLCSQRQVWGRCRESFLGPLKDREEQRRNCSPHLPQTRITPVLGRYSEQERGGDCSLNSYMLPLPERFLLVEISKKYLVFLRNFHQ